MSNVSPEVRRFLEEVRFAVVATINEDGTPQQTVLWYELRGDEIMMNTARGRVKDRNLRRDPRIAIAVEDGYRFVNVRGTARLVEDQTTAQADIRALAVRYDGAESAERQVRDQFSKEERISIYVPLERVTTHGF
jgi:PPOX class probable F420-dependent enzyme